MSINIPLWVSAMNFRLFIIFSIAILCLLSCGSSPTHQAKKNREKPTKKVIEVVKDSDYYLRQAKQIHVTGHVTDHVKSHATNNDIYQRNDYLIQAAEMLQAEQQCKKSIRMLKVLQPELQDNRHNTHASLILAECYLLLPDEAFEHVETILANLTHDDGYQARIASVEAQLHVNKKQWLRAAKALQNTDIEEQKKAQIIWQWVRKLNLAELEKARLAESALQPWLQLAIIVKRFALESELFKQQLVNWQSRHFDHPLVNNLPDEIEQSLLQSPIQGKRIAVLLPLTGRLANQGLAIKEGILSAYLDNLPAAKLHQNIQPDGQSGSQLGSQLNYGKSADHAPESNKQVYREIRFFDSALKTAQQLNTFVADFDVVLGPLVKEKITQLTAILPPDKILLALNRIELKTNVNTANSLANADNVDNEDSVDSVDSVDSADSQKAPNTPLAEHYYFSLAPEDEAQQLASHLQQNQLVRPIIFAADTLTTKRMAQAFITKWQETPDAIEPDLTIFTDNKDMRIRVSQMLDVAQSKKRIRQMEKLSDVEVFGVERNRRDIDAIVLFANPEQTKLLNPIIEASLSPFARKSLSVFASSRSYSLDLNSNSLRDLRNLTFTDMPWMLPGHNWPSLAGQTKQLWPQREDTLLRLFAMGFDAYNLLSNLRRLKSLPQTVSHGLTGAINVDSQGVLHRRLPWAQVGQDRVKLIAMD